MTCGIDTVCAALAIDPAIFQTLNALTNKGSAGLARKYSHKPEEHTSAELRWIRAVIRRLTRRLGEWEYDRTATLPLLSMSDLPPL